MNKQIRTILTDAGFIANEPGLIGDSFMLSLGNGWNVTAYCIYGPKPLDKGSYTSIDIHLADLVGTSHICHTEEALKSNLERILRILHANSSTPDILKCPKCKALYVSPKIPSASERWQPFLSCKGMTTTGKGSRRRVICDGVSKALPAVVHYR